MKEVLKMKKILAIVGSVRKDSFNKQLALAAQKILADKAELEILDYTDVPFFNQDLEHPAPAAVTRVRKLVKEADGLWIFTPEYNHYFSGVLKNLIDWLSRPVSATEPQVLAGKKIALSGITPGISGTGIAQDHLVAALSFLNADIMNVPRLTIPNAMQQVQDGKLVLTTSAPYLEKQAEAFVKYLG
jgi:chromate reductase